MKTQILCFAFMLAIIFPLSAQVSVNTDGTAPDGSAMLDVKSATRGALFPRIALTAANLASPVTSPATGLLVYNTATAGTAPNDVKPGFYFWNGSRWVAVVMPQGSATGEMLYWNGSQWVMVPPGLQGRQLSLCNGIPTWGACPELTTTPVSTIAETTATSGGNITGDGGSSITARGVCWSSSPSPDIIGAHTTDGSGTGAFASQMAALTANTQYYVRAYATNGNGTFYGNEITFATTVSDGQACPGTPTVSYGGQTYNTVKIGSQCWLRENLNIGVMMPVSSGQSNNGIIEKHCYNDLASNCVTYGGLYLWDEMMQYTTVAGVKGICPTGWHLPADGEYSALTTYLGGEGAAGGKMKSTGTIEAGTGLWYSPNTGATNSSGYTALPGGYCSGGSGLSYYLGYLDLVWTSTLTGNPAIAWNRKLVAHNATCERNSDYLIWAGMSARCVKDALSSVNTSGVTGVSYTAATGGGEVTSDGGSAVTARGICWNTTGAPVITDSHTSDGSGTGTFTSSLSGLAPGANYFVRAYATSATGTAYGNQLNFNTQQNGQWLTNNADIYYNAGNVGLGTSAPHAPLQFANGAVNRKIVLHENQNNDHQFYGFGINPNALRYQVDATSSSHIFAAATSATTSNELMRIQGNGNVGIGFASPYYKLDIGNAALGNTAGNWIPWLRLFGYSGNLDQLRIDHNRHAAGTDWSTAEIRIQRDVDGSSMHFISFSGMPGYTSALVFGYQSTPQMVLENDGNIGIGTSNPDEAAALDISSTTRGFLPPRMTTGLRNAIASPVAGLVIYNTDEKVLNVYNGIAWMSMVPVPAFGCGITLTVNHVISGGVAPVNKTVAYGTVNGIPGETSKCWITSNLGADHQATAVNDATEASAGWYWQFNRKQGFKHDGTTRTPNTTWISSISENSDWITANDPCIELGSGWRIPTSTEWTNVDASGSWTNWNSPFGSALKLHAAGNLYYSDGSWLFNRGSNGIYWSSTQSDATRGWYLGFANSASEMYNYYKSAGYSVRCVRDY